jgi:hypothetical protein
LNSRPADHMLKGQTGIDAAKEMKKIKPSVPIILYSGTNPETIQHVDVFINQGEPTATFLRIVHDVVRRLKIKSPGRSQTDNAAHCH